MNKRHSWSSITTLSTCPRKFYFGYVRNLEKRDKSANQAATLGTVVHYALAQVAWNVATDFLTTEEQVSVARQAVLDWYEENLEQDKTIYNWDMGLEVRDEGYYVMMNEVLDRARKIVTYQVPRLSLGDRYRIVKHYEFFDGGDDTPMVEFKVEAEIDGRWVVGYADLLVQDNQTGQFILIDWKTRSRYPNTAIIQMDGQLHLYAALINALSAGKNKISAVIQYQLRSSVPKGVKLTQRGEVSRDKRTGSTWEVWSADLELLGKRVQDYEDMREHMHDASYFTLPIMAYLTPESQHEALRSLSLLADVADMYQERGEWPGVYNHNVCNMCPFQRLCVVARNQGDYEHIIQKDYIIRERDIAEALDDGADVIAEGA